MPVATRGASASGLTCYKCGQKGHKKADCTGEAKPRDKGGMKPAVKDAKTEFKKPECYNCGTPGHKKADCFKGRGREVHREE